MQLGKFDLQKTVLIVAEIGNNHEGNFDVAKELILKAKECSVDAVKFQTFKTEYFVSRRDPARFDQLKSFELSSSQFEQLSELAHSLGLLFISTPLDLESVAFLEPLVDCYKIASGDNTFYPLMKSICQTGKPIILSSGFSDLEQIKKSKQFIEEQWKAKGFHQHLAVLHCVSSYPVPPNEVNLASIPFLANTLNCDVGFSDHTIGIEASLIAVAVGARILEKHFTLNKNYSHFRDHQLSADPPEMKRLVQEVGRVLTLLGKPEKVVQESEAKSSHLSRRSIVAAANLTQGHRLSWRDLTWMRPAVGMPPGNEERMVGKTLKRSLLLGEPILFSDLE